MWHETLDFYCERTSLGFWSEPVNAITNAGFILAGVLGLLKFRQIKNIWLLVLSLLSILTGIGSFLFHTYANRWSHLSDIIPIAIFMSTFVAFVARRLFAQSVMRTTFLSFFFILLSIVIEIYQPRHLLNGSLGYSHALLLLIFVTLKVPNAPLKKMFFHATLTFTTSLVFRTIDNNICDILSIGTHYLWHLLNAKLIYIILNIVMWDHNHKKETTYES